MNRWLITGGAGFIGSGFVLKLLALGEFVVVVDKLTYAARRDNLPTHPKLIFVQEDICNTSLINSLLNSHKITHLVNFAAESHVDNSINNSAEFIRTNIGGTHSLLEACLPYYKSLKNKDSFRYIQISTDEVFGSLTEDEPAFTEQSHISPNSPYSASKSAGDMLVNAWHHTYGLPVITTHCSNNYGPRQHKEKLIPRMIYSILTDQILPVYGTGNNIRDWIHVNDHCDGIYLAAIKGNPGEKYCFGGRSERRNIDIVKQICTIMDDINPSKNGKSRLDKIRFVEDRQGHDWRYAINDDYAQKTLGFKRNYKFEDGLYETIKWYINNPDFHQIN